MLQEGGRAMKYQYVIEGKVIKGPGIDDSAGYLSALGITVGSQVSYTFVIDLSAPGTIQHADGTISQYTDPNGRRTFYAHYVSGSTITAANHSPAYNNIAANNYGGVDMVIAGVDHERWLNLSNGNNFLALRDMLQQPNIDECWPGGASFGCPDMQNTIFNASGQKSHFHFDATIKQIWRQVY
jgi:hypothetical protein